MPSKKKSSKESKKERSLKGTGGISLETATRLLASSLLREDGQTFMRACDAPLPSDEREAFQARYKAAIEQAATMISLHSVLEEMNQDRTAEGVACTAFILRKLMDGKQNDNRPKTSDELMDKVWARIKNNKIMQDALRHEAVNSDLLTPQIADKFKDKLRREAPIRWRAFVKRMPHCNRIKKELIKTLSDEMGL
jgi:hypothetical protein